MYMCWSPFLGIIAADLVLAPASSSTTSPRYLHFPNRYSCFFKSLNMWTDKTTSDLDVLK